MRISYKKLWILLIEKEITPATLRKDLNIATGTMTKLRKNEEVALLTPMKLLRKAIPVCSLIETEAILTTSTG